MPTLSTRRFPSLSRFIINSCGQLCTHSSCIDEISTNRGVAGFAQRICHVAVCAEAVRAYEQNHFRMWYTKERKTIFKMNKEVGMLLQKRANTCGVGIRIMRKSIYLLTTSQHHRSQPHSIGVRDNLVFV